MQACIDFPVPFTLAAAPVPIFLFPFVTVTLPACCGNGGDVRWPQNINETARLNHHSQIFPNKSQINIHLRRFVFQPVYISPIAHKNNKVT